MKSKLLISLIILCVLFSLTTVSAADNQTEMLSESGDYHSFSELNQSISESNVEINLEHDYKYDCGVINVSKENKFTINGNNHVIEGLNGRCFIFDSKDVIVINNLTFQNCINASLMSISPVIFNNVKFINCTSSKDNFIEGQETIQFDGCFFQNIKANFGFISCFPKNIVFKNSVCYEGNFIRGFIHCERNNLIVENCTFENLYSHVGPAINYKGCELTVRNSKFLNLHADATGGAIVAKFFPENGTIIGNPILIEDCEFINCTSSSNGGAIYYDLESGSNFL